MSEQINIDEQLAMALITNAVINRGVVSPETFDLSILSKNRKNNPMVLITCTTRASSTFLGNVLCEIADLNWINLSSAYFNVENDLYLPALCIADRFRCLSVLHMRATYPSCTWINLFGIKTIINIRNVYDSIISFASYIRRRRVHPNYGTGYASPSMGWMDQNQDLITDEQLVDMVIDLFMPWYIQFYVSWVSVTERGEVDALWMSYENLKKDPGSNIKRILDYCEIKSTKNNWSIIYEKYPANNEKNHDNTNIKPRDYWARFLTEERRNKIKKFASYYPNIDFARIGIT